MMKAQRIAVALMLAVAVLFGVSACAEPCTGTVVSKFKQSDPNRYFLDVEDPQGDVTRVHVKKSVYVGAKEGSKWASTEKDCKR